MNSYLHVHHFHAESYIYCVNPSMLNALEKSMNDHGISGKIEEYQQVSGGSINEAYAIRTATDRYFLKINDAREFPGMFEKERHGLKILAQPKVMDVPKALFTGEETGKSFIFMSFIQSGPPKKSFWQDFAVKLASLHRVHAEKFGLDEDNYIGSLPQSNKEHDTWSDFFVSERLEVLAKKSFDLGELDRESMRQFDQLFHRMESLFPEERPSLIHGDLWSGNYMSNEVGDPVIFDPAVYYGHREMDIGMSRLFGGFSEEFYRSYQDCFPMESGWQERLDICNLYPLLVHVILFSGGYASTVKGILKRYV